MIGTICNIFLGVLAIALFVIWVIALADYDGSGECTREDYDLDNLYCKTCPFPCEFRDWRH